MQKQEQVHRILEGDSIKRRGFFEGNPCLAVFIDGHGIFSFRLCGSSRQ